MLTELYLTGVVLIAGMALFWNQYDYLRVVRSKTGESFPVFGSGMAAYIARPWRLLAGFDRLVRVGSARQSDPVIEAARQQFLRRRHLVVLGFFVAAVPALFLIPGSS